MLEQLRIGRQFASVRIFQNAAVAPDWFHYRDRVIEPRVFALRKQIREEYLRDYPLERGSVRVWLVFFSSYG